jgi:phosphatidylinositol-3-phosphatase
VLALVLAGCGSAGSGRGASAPLAVGHPARSGTSHIVIIMMENKEASDVLGSAAAPYINGLARRYGLATESFAITHPSLPNYLALTSGSTGGITSDCVSCAVNRMNIVDQLTHAGISWKAYLEDVPTPCYTGASAGDYVKKHNPFIYYSDIAHNRARCAHLVSFSALSADLRASRLPTYVWITPDLCHDTHDCGVATGDAFLAGLVPALLHELGPNGFLVLTWDEGSSNLGCCGGTAAGGHIATIVAGPEVIPGSRERAPVDDYGVLATIERALGLPRLAEAAAPRNGTLAALFKAPPHVVP